MQIEPTLSSQSINNTNTNENFQTAQYGLLERTLSASSAGSASSRGRDDRRSGSESGKSRSGSEELRIGRLRIEDSGEKQKPSFRKIEQHENALKPSKPKRGHQGPSFVVVSGAGRSGRADEIKLEAFPNGMSKLLNDGRKYASIISKA